MHRSFLFYNSALLVIGTRARMAHDRVDPFDQHAVGLFPNAQHLAPLPGINPADDLDLIALANFHFLCPRLSR